ncbi:hypothetical protein ACRQ5Q_09280 [Bradyrhizobium sp. PMVTL-01]|uniref:hypothetical protein n=1 Tax=Bradyrhizobium sp. PMVTL-01 TaxID=3434999 RepID=UPI003F6F3FB2
MQNAKAAQFEQEVLNSLQSMELELALRGGMNALPEQPDDTNPKRAEQQSALNEAVSLVKRRDVLERICPGLQSVAGDAQALAKWITPVLLPMAIAGTVPMSPLVFAGVAVLFFRVGVATLCKGCIPAKDKSD